jgi:hypothetical protein
MARPARAGERWAVKLKRCPHCNKKKELLANFFKRSDQPGKFRSWCKLCTNRQNRRFHLKKKCKRCGRPCTARICMRCISAAWRAVLGKRRCSVCGRKMSRSAGHRRKQVDELRCVRCRYLPNAKKGDRVGIFVLLSVRAADMAYGTRRYRFACTNCGTKSTRDMFSARGTKKCHGCVGRRGRQQLELFGVRISGPQMAAVVGLGTSLVYNRLLMGKSVAEAFLKPQKFHRPARGWRLSR